MADEGELPREINRLASGSADIVELLNVMCERHADFRDRAFISAIAVREGLGISVRQLNAVTGWLTGEVSDDLLREEIPFWGAPG